MATRSKNKPIRSRGRRIATNSEPAATESNHHEDRLGPVTRSFRWKNFRGFEDTAEIQLRRINIVLGANNSGKSSLLSPLLVLKQTIASADSTQPIITKGPFASIGNFGDYIRDHDASRSLSLSFSFHGHVAPPEGIDPVERTRYQPGVLHIDIGASPETGETRLDRFQVDDVYGRMYITRALQKDGGYSFDGPIRLLMKDKKAIARIRDQRPRGFLFGVLLPHWTHEDKLDESTAALHLYNAVMSTVRNEVGETLSKMAFIGPMRERPQRYYEHTGEAPPTVGPRGENTCELLFRERERILPDLSSAMSRLGLADTIEFQDAPNSEVFSVNLRTDGISVNLADSGFGVSQVLPILVQAFIARSTKSCRSILVKQPEIHLNPRQQTVLAELLVELSQNAHMIIETHSEHIVLALRRLVAEQRIPNSEIALHFVERKKGVSTVREIPVSPSGHVEADEWPEGFFGDSLRESMGLAKAQVALLRKSTAVATESKR